MITTQIYHYLLNPRISSNKLLLILSQPSPALMLQMMKSKMFKYVKITIDSQNASLPPPNLNSNNPLFKYCTAKNEIINIRPKLNQLFLQINDRPQLPQTKHTKTNAKTAQPTKKKSSLLLTNCQTWHQHTPTLHKYNTTQHTKSPIKTIPLCEPPPP